MAEDATTSDLRAENAALRARVDALETEVAALRADTAGTLAKAQDSIYWFERWGVDFNSLFARPQMEYARKGVRGVRAVYRKLVAAKRRALG